jgi:dihydrofolate reductase
LQSHPASSSLVLQALGYSDPPALSSSEYGDILVAGSATLVAGLREYDLVDEYHLSVYPVVLGQGKKLFKDGGAAADLSLIEARKAGPDVQLLIYRPANRAA